MNQNEYFVVLDDALAHTCRYYQGLRHVDAIQAADVLSVDALLQQGWAQGLQVVLWQSYDFGWELMYGGKQAALYLLWFERCEVLADDARHLPWLQAAAVPTGIAALHNQVAEAEYLQRIDAIHAAITRGDVYQINYTSAWTGEVYGEPSRLYARLRARQQVPYGVLAHLPPEVNEGAAWHLGFSPELFLHIQADGHIMTKPMKGTAPLLGDGLDEERAAALRSDAKNRAENVMIVDLLRNDLGKLAVAGGVSVPQAFEVQAFGSVWQMTSTVVAQMRPETTVANIIQAAFPCGSITGAPKRMAMQVIEQLEQRQRGLYTGSVGYLEPCDTGLGFTGTWNVVIRSLQLRAHATPQRYGLSMGIGSGIVIDSVGADEWDECHWKARFARGLSAEVGVFETLRVENGRCELLALHQARLQQSVRDLHIVCDVNALWQDLQAACESEWAQGLWRVKCAVAADGQYAITAAAMVDFEAPQTVCLSEQVLPNQDVLRRYKTTMRTQFDKVWQGAVELGAFDGLLFNQDGFLLEGGRSNVFIELDGQWYTPSTDLDILNGVMRQAILQNPAQYGFTGRIIERADIGRAEVLAATRIRLSNALRGVFAVGLVETLM
ncbi:bifunctional anthranilate synthase component I family protein/aminotransferase class IV [Vitreoscilla massiliensis]|uniref:Bifunctional anthranilate synthase component I family protein/aminotransferase class IV n=1 Tax=Vitreoscilla massiliensis TaxID=1689272 RepID=A0ABY4E4H5_9NEIS|nr:bifunctional anthranilate synthase component I family protein/class IV aminotransferase [Vitreoscilla massiliensis]UOO90407.1 bifunctional anthranilate synthase component I family protein/aminotransferase class IV [Vitreoscilla massiliensis]